MDNASKALVMAGAILIAVMLISLGVFLFNQAQKVTQDVGGGVTVMGITAYNSKYETYFGKNKSYAETKALISAVRTHNNNVEEVGAWGIIKITKESSATINPLTAPENVLSSGASYGWTENTIKQSKQYTIGLKATNKLGAVSQIGIYEQSTYVQD